ncbi:MAG TPA: hypothetical protein VFR81_03440 [Longimicrobium sp.]|nr:hypothetical protein [Longimicrobium sp.]
MSDEHAGRFYNRHGAEDLTKDWLAWNDIGIVLGRSAAPDRGESIES